MLARPNPRTITEYIVKKLLNTAYITTEDAAPRKDGETLATEVVGAEKLEFLRTRQPPLRLLVRWR